MDATPKVSATATLSTATRTDVSPPLGIRPMILDSTTRPVVRFPDADATRVLLCTMYERSPGIRCARTPTVGEKGRSMSATGERHQIVISTDGHCGADLRDYKPYLEQRY